MTRTSFLAIDLRALLQFRHSRITDCFSEEKRKNLQKKKARPLAGSGFVFWSGGDLLSHANAHYHRRKPVSRSCSGWEGVVPGCYSRQVDGRPCAESGSTANKGGRNKAFWRRDRAKREDLEPVRDAHGYRVKPHGQLVLVS